MKIYVAGKWEDRIRVKMIMNILEKLGHKITCDWTDHKYEDEAYPVQYAMDDVNGVLEADIFIGVFLSPYQYRGALVEMGIAIGKGIPVWLLGKEQDDCIFTSHPNVCKFGDELSFISWVITDSTQQ